MFEKYFLASKITKNTIIQKEKTSQLVIFKYLTQKQQLTGRRMKNSLLSPICNMVQALPDSKLADFTKELLHLWVKYPEIQASIVLDLNIYAKQKKLIRLKDREYELNQIDSLPGFDDCKLVPESANSLTLDVGAPRTPEILIFLFMQLRGYWGSVSDAQAMDNIVESITMNTILQNLSAKLPGRSTIIENINAVTNETREILFECQLADVLEMKLDDFKVMLIDSTSVEANNRWPTDAGVIVRLMERVIRQFSALEKFGIGAVPDFYLPHWLKKSKQCHFTINNTSGFKGAVEARKNCYNELYKEAGKAVNYLVRYFQPRKVHADNLDIAPSQKTLVQTITASIERDLADIVYVIEYSRERICEGKSRPSAEKIMSLSDDAAAFIKKGDRTHVIGYKPQLARSAVGFVTALLVESGNPSDSKQFLPTVENHIANTGVTPELVNADDGYSSQEGFDDVKGLDVDMVSLSGAKGKKILGDDLWVQDAYIDARRNRSAVESLMFTLKYVYEFGRMRRRGMEEVRAEMLEKVTAHNIMKAAKMKRARYEEERKVSLPQTN